MRPAYQPRSSTVSFNSNPNLSASKSKKQYLTLTSRASSATNLRKSMVSLPVTFQKPIQSQTLFQSQVRTTIPRVKSQVIVKQTIKAIPVHFSYSHPQQSLRPSLPVNTHRQLPRKMLILQQNNRPRLNICSRPNLTNVLMEKKQNPEVKPLQLSNNKYINYNFNLGEQKKSTQKIANIDDKCRKGCICDKIKQLLDAENINHGQLSKYMK